MEKVSIKEYAEEYKNEIIDLILDIQQNEFHIPITREDQPDLESVSSFYQTGSGNFWTAIDEGHVVGTIALIDIGNRKGVLRKMFVNKDYRGNGGTAQSLMRQLINWSKLQDMDEIYLGTTEKFVAAHHFYEKFGFVQITKEQLPASFPIMKVDTRFYKYNL